MNRLAIVLLLLALLVSLPLAGCQSPLKASGELKTEDFNFTDFSHVQANGPFNIEIVHGDEYRVSITADDNIFEKIEITSEEGILKLELERSRFLGISRTQYIDATVKAVITMPYVRGLTLDGAAEGIISGFETRASMAFALTGASKLDIDGISVGDTAFDVSGASKVTGKIAAGDVCFDVDGTSIAELEGTASNIACKVGGASNLKLENFAVDNADMKLNGASKSIINLDGKLDVNLSGASDLSYYGNPVMGDTKISGGSTMSRK